MSNPPHLLVPREPTKTSLNVQQPIAEQLQSPLFSQIPAELRNHIFKLALQPYQDPLDFYPRETYYTRPGTLGKSRIATELLCTCKRIYLETKDLPPQHDTTVTFYGGESERVPRHYISVGDMLVPTWFQKLSASQVGEIQHLRLVSQLYAFKAMCSAVFFDPFSREDKRGALAPSTVTITIRYTDFWGWEHDVMLHLRGLDPTSLVVPESVTKIELELEQREGKREDLEGIIAGIPEEKEHWKFKRKDGRFLVVQDDVREWRWIGPTKFIGITHWHHPKGNEMPMFVKVLTFLLQEDPYQGRI
ncbi:hypothetical protein BU24DRAFT_447147 [Aaosphaeria arxii CBS 175.79]|uniref:Uncharacterized protein n=1 Tax=Aaosphaeria arxii CBS 175.79 TaxID=1450172 RepID=A0A6A5YA87_9PLEO|nr:uncharacterized protein BU24DRAFT_447147 [Aaosphaeria arxii CBS 175.79]KAF2022358.1 hypothetical protein BU24DRAFT_447147 [Aaosphaeria arxii CBS 175.79]